MEGYPTALPASLHSPLFLLVSSLPIHDIPCLPYSLSLSGEAGWDLLPSMLPAHVCLFFLLADCRRGGSCLCSFAWWGGWWDATLRLSASIFATLLSRVSPLEDGR